MKTTSDRSKRHSRSRSRSKSQKRKSHKDKDRSHNSLRSDRYDDKERDSKQNKSKRHSKSRSRSKSGERKSRKDRDRSHHSYRSDRYSDKSREKFRESDSTRNNTHSDRNGNGIQVEEVKSSKSAPSEPPSIFNRIKKSLKTEEEQLEALKSQVSFMLADDAPRKQYSRTKDWNYKKSIIHWGQRKLFFSELWFLVKYGELSKSVVYAGSAPGTHIPFLAKLFPEHNFILVDPNEFRLKQIGLENADTRIKVIQGYFTDELATELANTLPDSLFISDIRTANHSKQDPEKVEVMVREDNLKQRDWINIMKPKKSLLKFRCPYPDRKMGKENLKMFKGEIYIQPYAAPTSTETRLVPDDSLTEIEYDNVKYEEQLYYHNHVTRRKEYDQPILDGEGFNTSWDLSAEVIMLYDFLRKFPNFYEEEPTLFGKIKKLSYDISRSITETNRNLLTPMIDPTKRRQFADKDHTHFYPDLDQRLAVLHEEDSSD